MEKKRNQTKSYRFKRFARKSYSAFASIGKIVSIGVMAGTTLTAMSTKAVGQSVQQKPAKTIVKELEEVVVSASIAETIQEEVTRSIVVISRQEIEQAPVQSISDLLVYIAGVDVQQRGGHGVQTDISLRGSSQDQIAILLNGINLSNAQTGHFALDFPINTSDIERIEILSGPSALILGSSAFSGGINIITKKEYSEKIFARIEAGMHDFRALEVRGSARTENLINTLSAGHRSSDGYIDNSDYSIYNLLWQSRLDIKKHNKIDLQLGYNDKKFGANTFYSALYPNQYEETSSYLATLKGDFGTIFKISPHVYWNRHHDRFDLIRNTTTGQNMHRTDSYGANLALTYKSGLGNISLNGEIRKDEIMSTKLGIPMQKPHRKYTMYDARTNVNTGLEYSLKWNKLNLDVGVLMNNNSLESRKYHLLPSASAAYSPIQQLKAHASWSKSTRLPTFTDLYYTTETHIANEALRSEYSEAWEVGLNFRKEIFSAYLTVFASWGDNIIDWVKENPADKWMSWNHSKVKTKGIETGIKIDLHSTIKALGDDSYLKVDYSYLTQDAKRDDLITLYSTNYLKNKLTVNFHHQLYKGSSASWFFRLQDRNGTFISYKNSADGEKHKYPLFSTLDIKLNYIYKEFNIFLNLNNLYDTHYYDIGNIPQAGFWLTGGVSYMLK